MQHSLGINTQQQQRNDKELHVTGQVPCPGHTHFFRPKEVLDVQQRSPYSSAIYMMIQHFHCLVCGISMNNP